MMHEVKLELALLLVSLLLNDAAAGVKEVNPAPLLVIEGLGNGYSTPLVTADRIFITGEMEGIGFLFAYDITGRQLWKTKYGDEWSVNFPGSRATPAIIDSTVYTSSGMGDIACFNARTGEKQWTVSMIRQLHGTNAVFGYSIPVLIDKDRIYCQPGGPDTNIACLDRFTGKIIWKSAGDGETPGYTSPLLIHLPERDLLVVFSELGMLGLDADTGELLWTWELSLKGDAPCNNAIYSDGFLYMVAGRVNGAAKFEISQDGARLTRIWKNDEFNTYFGGYVMIGSFLYGSSESRRFWLSVDAGTGKNADTLHAKPGAVALAGEDMVIYDQAGTVGLVRLDHGKMNLVSSFKITAGTNEHFSHPLLAGERLYIRHGDALLVYDYRQLKSL